MLSIGVTGGIGSGKSTICSVLEHLGYPVFYSDLVAKQNMLENLDLIKAITQAFGKEAYTDKQLNRNFLSNQIFKKPALKEKLNGLVHPTVFQSFERWKEIQQSSLVFNESALLFETGSYKRFDAIWLVIADEEDRIKRVMKREKCSREDVMNRIKNQLSDADKTKFNSDLIYNSENNLVVEQVLALLKKFNQL
jgi:dephospho-CoA kinase